MLRHCRMVPSMGSRRFCHPPPSSSIISRGGSRTWQAQTQPTYYFSGLKSNATSSSSKYPRRFGSTSTATSTQKNPSLWSRIQNRPVEYLSIPCVAAFVGITTNWMGVKMLFYPIEYFGIDWKRSPDVPYGMWGWQGVVPTKTEIMAKRLVNIVTSKLLSLEEAFGRLDPQVLANHLGPAIQEAVRQESGEVWAKVLEPCLPFLLPFVIKHLQREIGNVLDLDQIVLSAFVRDKEVLVDLFQKVGRVELEFLVNSGFGFGFMLGLGQMIAWARFPMAWTLPAAGALVGWITNAIAIKFLFEPAEPINVANIFVLQGLFESRQIEVSDEFAQFMNERVLNSRSLLQYLASGEDNGDLYAFLRRHLPSPIPSHILKAAVAGIAEVADHPHRYPHVHKYVSEQLDIENTLARRLKRLSPTQFEDLLHPVFQEDETTLIATGGVLGFLAGALQTKLGWGGVNATRRAWVTIGITLASSAFLYAHQKYEEITDEPLASQERPQFQRRETIFRPPLETDPQPQALFDTVDRIVPGVKKFEATVEGYVVTRLPEVPGLVRKLTKQESSTGDDKDS